MMIAININIAGVWIMFMLLTSVVSCYEQASVG